MRHPRGDIKRETECRLGLREEIPALTRKAACHCRAGGPAELPRDSVAEADLKGGGTQAHRTGEAWPERQLVVSTSSKKNRDENEAGRENWSAEMGQSRDS